MPSACQVVVDFIGLFYVRVERTFATKNWHFENLSLMTEIDWKKWENFYERGYPRWVYINLRPTNGAKFENASVNLIQ